MTMPVADMAPMWLVGGTLMILGAVLGSFAATVLIRAPTGHWALNGRSRCDHCGRILGLRDLVPILSAMWLNGRCRACGGAIARVHTGAEGLCAVIGLGLGLAFPPVQALMLLLMAVQLVLLALLDLRHYWLPDRLTGCLAITGLALGGLATHASLPDRGIGLALGYGLLALLRLSYRRVRGREGMGGGDPKLAGAILAWLGWQALPALFLGASLIGIGWAVIRILWQTRRHGALPHGQNSLKTLRIPFGTALALAAMGPMILPR